MDFVSWDDDIPIYGTYTVIYHLVYSITSDYSHYLVSTPLKNMSDYTHYQMKKTSCSDLLRSSLPCRSRLRLEEHLMELGFLKMLDFGRRFLGEMLGIFGIWDHHFMAL